MEPKSEKPLRMFVNPFAIWTSFAFKTAEAMWASAHAAAARSNALKVAVIPTADVPPPKAEAPAAQPVRHAVKPVQQASKAPRLKAARAKVRGKAKAKRRAKR
jgi:hypothetical protein